MHTLFSSLATNTKKKINHHRKFTGQINCRLSAFINANRGAILGGGELLEDLPLLWESQWAAGHVTHPQLLVLGADMVPRLPRQWQSLVLFAAIIITPPPLSLIHVPPHSPAACLHLPLFALSGARHAFFFLPLLLPRSPYSGANVAIHVSTFPHM